MARLIGYANRVNLKFILRALQDAQREEKSKGPLMIFWVQACCIDLISD